MVVVAAAEKMCFQIDVVIDFVKRLFALAAVFV
jgi:hypothetical protein